MKPVRTALLTAGILALSAISASAQPVISAKPGVIAYVQGKVTMNDQVVEYSPTHFPDIKENSVVRTEDGLAEILLTPGVILRLGENSSIKMLTNRLIDTRLELLTGSAVVEADDIAKDTAVTIVCRDATATLTKKGVFRFDADSGRLKVFEGSTVVHVGDQNIDVGSGRMLDLGSATASVKFDKEDTDSLDNWSKRRAALMASANISAAHSLLQSGFYGSYGSIYGGCVNSWGFNPWFGMMTYIPCSGVLMSPYGFRYWSPYTVTRAYYVPPAGGYNGGGSIGMMPSYPTMAQTSSGYSGAVAAAPAMSSPGAASASSAASSSASSSVGRGSASGGGHGK
jgi:hypothetical protein